MSRPWRERCSYFPLWVEYSTRLLAALFYRVSALGAERVPAAGGALLLCNHLSYADAVPLQLACPRPLRFVGYEEEESPWYFKAIFRLAGVIPISTRRPMAGMRRALRALEAGELVCLFPEGHISRTCQLLEIKEGFALLARRARVPVIPAAMDGLWDSILSFSGNRFLWKLPRLRRLEVTVAFGAPLPPERAEGESARRAMLEMGAEAFAHRSALGRHLGREAVRALARRPWRVALVDRTEGRRPLSAGSLLAAGAALSRRWRGSIGERRVGVVLPPGAGALVANLGVVLAGKVPVNLSFLSGRDAAEAALKLAGIRTVVTAAAMRERLPSFPWPERTLDLRAEISAAGGRAAILPWLAAAWILPGALLADRLGLPGAGGDAEAALLFTSGSAGNPRGVILTHRNLLANCTQFALTSLCPPDTVILGCLPVFHSFGFTVTMWFPLLWRRRLVTCPNPLETRRLIDAVREERVTVVAGAPTFLRPWLKKARPEELRSVRQVVAGAEKLPADLERGFRERFGLDIIEGYGLTEASPVVSVNQPDPPGPPEAGADQAGRRAGTVGRLLPGVAARLIEPETGAEAPLTGTGLLCLKGANLFPGYLEADGGVRPAGREGWYATSDLARFDPQGFLTIEGRRSRFSKIGGEMVPHGAVEERVCALFGLEAAEAPAVLVVGVPDPAKGETLVLLTSADLGAEEVRRRLHASGMPNLWIPKTVRKVDRIPLLGSGKLDLAAGREIALRS